ncbi:MAG TPA: hypothetical protein VGD62_13815 [Acidobacteriaceae bacterium]
MPSWPRVTLVLALLTLAACAARAEHAMPAAQQASAYPAVDAHPAEHLTIAADPYDTPAKVSAFRVNYLKYNILPIRVIVTNDGDRPISLNQVRIHFLPADGNRVQAAEPEDVERRVTTKDRLGKSIPVGPVTLHTGGSASDKKIEQDFNEHQYAALAVEPHTTRAGFLFYDMEGLGKEPLQGAKLLVRRVQDADGKDLFAFEVPLDKYVKSVETSK